jgi:cytochrome P450
MRTASRDTELHGTPIKKGDWLMLSYLSGNRDEEAFGDAHDFCVRPVAPRSVAFGHGPHVCLGQHLARLQMRLFFEEFFARVRSIELAGEPRRAASLFVGGPKNLPLRYAML